MPPDSSFQGPIRTWHRGCLEARMTGGTYSGVAALRAQEKRLEAVAHNLANANTPAFKRNTSVTEAFTIVNRNSVDEQPRTRHQRSYVQGSLNRTGVPTHLALYGEGFFAVEGDDGERYTRDGTFRVDDEGVLQTSEGYPLAWDGPRGRVEPTGMPITFEPDGTVKQNGQALGQLRIVDFAEPQALELDGSGFYYAPVGLAEIPSEAAVHQGALEGSNSSPVDELIELIRIQRNFESVTRMMAQVDQTYQRLVRSRP